MAELEAYIVITKWGFKWLRFACDYVVNGGPADKFAKEVLRTFEDVSEEPLEYVETHITTVEKKVVDHVRMEIKKAEVKKVKKVLAKGKRSAFSASIAKIAYNKFGERKMTEANVLVTRKWIQKLLAEDEYKDLRTCDKNLAIDRALFLSFLPTKDFQAMKVATATKTWRDRLDEDSVFGRIFRLVGSGSQVDPGSVAF